jgi:hypothetical protein
MNDFKAKDKTSNKLAEAILAEIPDQMVGYMHLRNINVGEDDVKTDI